MLRQLNNANGPEIGVTYSLAGFADKIGDNPQLRKWLYSQIKKGKIRRDALQILRQWAERN